jgi:two-component system sensor histidine kinase/response regulator
MADDQEIMAATEKIVQRARERMSRHMGSNFAATDQAMAKLLVAQWLFAIVLAIFVSPLAWEGKESHIHPHVWIAVGLGAVVISLPLLLAALKPGATITRHSIAVAMMLTSTLLIHLTGGRIETHFHIFGGLAFLAFYNDWKVLITGALATATDHLVRQTVWPESIYGIGDPVWWRFLEHAGWVVFCTAFLVWSCVRQSRQWQRFAEEGGMMEALAESEWRSKSVLERQ